MSLLVTESTTCFLPNQFVDNFSEMVHLICPRVFSSLSKKASSASKSSLTFSLSTKDLSVMNL